MWCWAVSARSSLSAARSAWTATRRRRPSSDWRSEIGLSAEQMAEGILRIAVVSMAAAIKEVSVLRGIDPRDFALLSYGGAGPLHAAAIADELGMRTVVVPPMPGNFSAFGLLVGRRPPRFRAHPGSDRRSLSPADIRAMLRACARTASASLATAGFPPARRRFAATLDMRYSGQSFELSVPVDLDLDDVAKIVKAFEAVYEARYGGTTTAPVEIVSYRIAAWGLSDKPALAADRRRGPDARWRRQSAHAPVVFDGRRHQCPSSTASACRQARPLRGPAIIEEAGSSTVVPPGWSTELDPIGCLVLRRREREPSNEHRPDHARSPRPRG